MSNSVDCPRGTCMWERAFSKIGRYLIFVMKFKKNVPLPMYGTRRPYSVPLARLVCISVRRLRVHCIYVERYVHIYVLFKKKTNTQYFARKWAHTECVHHLCTVHTLNICIHKLCVCGTAYENGVECRIDGRIACACRCTVCMLKKILK